MSNLRALVYLECQNSGQGLEDIIRMKPELNKFNQERYQGAVIRSRAVEYFLRETQTKKKSNEGGEKVSDDYGNSRDKAKRHDY